MYHIRILLLLLFVPSMSYNRFSYLKYRVHVMQYMPYIHKEMNAYLIRLSRNFVLLLICVFFRLEFPALSTCRCKSASAASPSPLLVAFWHRSLG